MNKLPNIEEAYKKLYLDVTPENVQLWRPDDIKYAMEMYGKQVWNAALEWAAKNGRCEDPEGGFYAVDKGSILKGKL